ncbi:hypothetical protein [Methylobacterium planeticum]|uniref:Uncharacterized protein n=1 Tax=Methylobacterium planeticum TaxID=2615211 RepID=A0A6N6MH98_9HYPH|nr:hypothetical protein [Methylobacterium planeticum]KAB1069258.1 hypothetical protein F6X51_25630 [Methylobacterium planeticum]
MTKTAYRIGEGANLAVFPHGTKAGDVVRLTEAQAMYEHDMGRITFASEDGGISSTIDDANEQIVIAGETRDHPVGDMTGKPLDLTDEERAALPALDPNASDEPENRTLGQMKTDPGDGIEKTPVAADTLTVDETAAKPRKAR